MRMVAAKAQRARWDWVQEGGGVPVIMVDWFSCIIPLVDYGSIGRNVIVLCACEEPTFRVFTQDVRLFFFVGRRRQQAATVDTTWPTRLNCFLKIWIRHATRVGSIANQQKPK